MTYFYLGRLLCLLTIFLATSCTPSTSNLSKLSTVLPFGTYDLPDTNGVQPQALVGGTLVLVDGCLYLESDGYNYIAVFPHQHTKWFDIEKVLMILDYPISVGTKIKTNGAYSQNTALLKERLVHQIPSNCKSFGEVRFVGTEAWD